MLDLFSIPVGAASRYVINILHVQECVRLYWIEWCRCFYYIVEVFRIEHTVTPWSRTPASASLNARNYTIQMRIMGEIERI